MKVNVKWDCDKDCDGDCPSRLRLPRIGEFSLTGEGVVEVPNQMVGCAEDVCDLEDKISDWLSDEYGFCHFSWSVCRTSGGIDDANG